MAGAEKYAQWIVKNADKKGTPEFQTVAKAYEMAKTEVPKTEVNPVAGTVRAGLQGLTFGFSDEIGSAIGALAGSIATGEKYSDVYSKMQTQLGDKREQFSSDNPVLSTGAEIAGGMLTGGVGGAKVLGGKAFQQASNLGKLGRISGVGAAEGGIYGAGTADQDARLSGGATGALIGGGLAPLGAGAINAGGKVIGSATNYAADKLAKTPKSQAVQALRDTADAVGMTADDAVNKMKALGSQGVIADLNDGFRAVARAGMNKMGTMTERGRNVVNARQKSQQQRLMTAIRSTGGDDVNYSGTVAKVTSDRANKAAPMYEEAYTKGIQETPDVTKLLANPLLRQAQSKARKYAESEGTQGDLLKLLHHTKEALDDEIDAAMNQVVKQDKGATHARHLLKVKERLLGVIEAQNPEYIAAKNVYAGESRLLNALRTGRDILKKDPEDIELHLRDLGESELELFRLGGVKAISKLLDKSVGENRDATKRLLNTSDMRQRLALVMGDDATEFLRRAGVEEKFTQTRNMLTGNSSTALQTEMGQVLDNSVDAGLVKSIATGNPASVVSVVIDTLSKGKISPEVVDELGKLMFKNGMSEQQIRGIFNTPKIRQVFGESYDQIVAPYIRGGISPAISADYSGLQ